MSKNSKLNVLGVMTGTSMDGVDISLIKTNGTDFVKIKCEKSYKFDKNYQNTINNLILNKPKTNNIWDDIHSPIAKSNRSKPIENIKKKGFSVKHPTKEK